MLLQRLILLKVILGLWVAWMALTKEHDKIKNVTLCVSSSAVWFLFLSVFVPFLQIQQHAPKWNQCEGRRMSTWFCFLLTNHVTCIIHKASSVLANRNSQAQIDRIFRYATVNLLLRYTTIWTSELLDLRCSRSYDCVLIVFGRKSAANISWNSTPYTVTEKYYK
jgi:uncharacterized membrane protein